MKKLLLIAAAAVLPVLPAAAQVTPQTIAGGLEHPWAVTFIGDGNMLVTERPGRLRVVQSDGSVGAPIAGVPEVDAEGQGGLLDVIADRDFAQNRTIYFCYAQPGEGGNSTALAKARLAEDLRSLQQVQVLFVQQPKIDSSQHFGCRIVDRGDGTLFLTLGERFIRMEMAQQLDTHLGKVVRIGKDGSVPADNPFAGKTGARPEIWSYGHRNPQGATLGPDGRLWIHEHGPRGGDEINLPVAGANYGWPLVSYGLHYSGEEVGNGSPTRSGVAAPIYHWTPSIAPSGMAFLTSDRYGEKWRGNLFVGALAGRRLVRLQLDGDDVVAEEKLLEDFARIRDVRMGPDGLLYLLTDEQDGRLVRLQPQP